MPLRHRFETIGVGIQQKVPCGRGYDRFWPETAFENRGLDDIQAQALSPLKLGRAAKSIGESLSSIHHLRVLEQFPIILSHAVAVG